jgi:DNA polymerase-3 subunit gamma/tau
MLKTLEEPPEHLKFILATTDPQKIPVTVLSRCLQFNLKQMPREAIRTHLEGLLKEEKIAFESEALSLIGRAASGSMRDALSLLDQAIAHGGGKVTATGVGEMLGAIDQGFLLRLLESIAGGDAAAAVGVAAEMQTRSLSFDTALADLASLLLKLALAQSAPDALEADLPERARVLELAGRLDAETVQLCYQIALQGREDLPLAPDEHGGFVMTILRMLAFRPESEGREPAPARKAPAIAAAPKSSAAAPKASAATGDSAWPQLVQSLTVTGAARELARNAELKRRDGSLFELVVPKSKAYLAERSYQEKLKAALDQHLGTPVTVKVTVGDTSGATAAAIEAGERDASRAAAAQAVQKDGFVNDLVNLLDGKVVDSSIRPEGK